MPPSQTALPADVVAAAAHADQQAVRPGELHRGDDIGEAAGLDDQAGRRSIRLFQTRRAAS